MSHLAFEDAIEPSSHLTADTTIDAFYILTPSPLPQPKLQSMALPTFKPIRYLPRCPRRQLPTEKHIASADLVDICIAIEVINQWISWWLFSKRTKVHPAAQEYCDAQLAQCTRVLEQARWKKGAVTRAIVPAAMREETEFCVRSEELLSEYSHTWNWAQIMPARFNRRSVCCPENRGPCHICHTLSRHGTRVLMLRPTQSQQTLPIMLRRPVAPERPMPKLGDIPFANLERLMQINAAALDWYLYWIAMRRDAIDSGDNEGLKDATSWSSVQAAERERRDEQAAREQRGRGQTMDRREQSQGRKRSQTEEKRKRSRVRWA
ncbi:hypothetical protein K461DRAFT_272169 [Myriangium duriaei CBS 260.36]|uniref:Uncharacterized protein n=1 Tax=Myriangium duriaei CBS 260.36 TaxID=1168546 RepID=A0A9P4MBU5_9PEZI|nr:hypothetical protein K461DRAFT_272169 [Myriangium duriaei CBS 260.36]